MQTFSTSKARFLIRFDDLCPTMNWGVWREIERILLETGVRPILAVVPDNLDPELMLDPAREDFWDHVRTWQSRGWTIGLHGYQHKYVTADPGIIGKNRFSEFAGLPYEVQAQKLNRAVEIFRRKAVSPTVWIAPAHSFDAVTIEILGKLGIRIISDGYFVFPHTDSNGVFWLPQQLWTFKPRLFGVWTICLHHNLWTQKDVRDWAMLLNKYRGQIGELSETVATFQRRSRSWMDRAFSRLLLGRIRAGAKIRSWKTRFKSPASVARRSTS